jgi:quercetin dioxygenase-like cupin family protein
MEAKYIRLYAGTDGESHFEDVKIPLAIKRGVGQQSEFREATGIIFIESNSSKQLDWHNAPRRQFIINLEGEREVEIGDGTRRILRPGDILLAEDTTGRGHITRLVKGKSHKAVFVTLD